MTLSKLRITIPKWFVGIPLLFLAAYIFGTICYLISDYIALKAWYLHLFPCIYRHSYWTEQFFTPEVLRLGKIYAALGLLISLVLSTWLFRMVFKHKSFGSVSIQLNRSDSIPLFILYGLAISCWIYGFLVSYPAYDEVFSAINCAGIHPFQTVSYYMLPNNHVFFNLLNGTIFHWVDNKVVSGRVISGIAMLALIPVLYFWLLKQTKSRYYATLFGGLMLLQFPVWAFSFQARGYAIYLFCAWVAILSLQKYLESRRGVFLVIHGLVTVIGFWIMPAYLFWEIAILLYALIYMICFRKLEWKLIITHVIAACFVYLAYLPILLFSGKAAVTDNRYVKAGKILAFKEYWPGFKNTFRCSIQYCFSGNIDGHNWSYLILFFLPVLLYFLIRKTGSASFVGFYIITWLVLTAMILNTQVYPFMRNLIAHDSITLGVLLISIYTFANQILGERYKLVRAGLFSVAVLGMAYHFTVFNRGHIHDSIYSYEADVRYKSLQSAVLSLPAGARVGLSDEGFYWQFLCERRGIPASMCMGVDANYYIKIKDTESLPAMDSSRATLWKMADEYEIYKLK